MDQSVSRETLHNARLLYKEHEEKLEDYLDQLLWWNNRVNLVSRSVSRETVRRHVLHSLLPVGLNVLDGERQWIDAGTGGGLPGIPLAIVSPEKQWYLNDRNRKKVASVKQMIHSLGLPNAEGCPGSIDEIEWPALAGVITKHAFPVDRLIPLIEDRRWERMVLFKGVDEPDVQLAMAGIEGFDSSLYRFEFEENPFFDEKGILVLDRTSTSFSN